MNDKASNYFAAAQYACDVLGDDAPNYFPRLHQLSRYNSLDELQAIVDDWRPPVPKPIPAPIPKPERWTPCKHFGGDRECDRCKRENTTAGLIYAGAMALADKIYQEHRKFVRSRIHAELLPYTGGKVYPGFDDLEQKVWQAVAARIAGYADTGTPLAWLRDIVHGTVIDHFRRTFADKRGDNKTVPLDFDPASPTSPLPVPVKSNRPTGEAPDADQDLSESYERSETVGRKMARGK